MENNYEVAFGIILHAGNAKSMAMSAIRDARNYKFDEATKKIEEAEKELTEAHHIQTKLIQDEAGGQAIVVDLIMVHAQDHLNGGMMCIEQAKEFMIVYQEIQKLKREEH